MHDEVVYLNITQHRQTFSNHVHKVMHVSHGQQVRDSNHFDLHFGRHWFHGYNVDQSLLHADVVPFAKHAEQDIVLLAGVSGGDQQQSVPHHFHALNVVDPGHTPQ